MLSEYEGRQAGDADRRVDAVMNCQAARNRCSISAACGGGGWV